ncbi:MAG: peptidoglycan-binding protein [Candidatus Tectomicrobia bacterium]|nr:peptidoglycan-binding protein [Candidatus Tectomicrobia bacterium]
MSFKARIQKNGKAALKSRSLQQPTQHFSPSAHQTHLDVIIQKVQLSPHSLTPQDVLHLQNMVGNRAVGRFLTPALQNSDHASSSSLVQKQPAENDFDLPVQRQEGLEEEEELQRKSEPEVLQGKFTPNATPIQLQGDREEAENRTGMTDRMKAGLESLSGMDLSDVRVHANSSKPAQLNALAYTQGQDIYVGPGQEKHLPHEGWHAVQQMQGRVKPTMQARRAPINDDAGLEREADAMGAKALQMTHVPIKQPRRHHQVVSSLRQVNGNTQIQRVAVSPSARFGGDKELEKVFNGTKTFKKGSRGIQVVKIQQALLDMGYTLPVFGVDGKFEDETEKAVKKFQKDKSIPENGQVDKTTLDKMQEVYDTRQPYLDNATFDPADPGKGTRTLDATEKSAVKSALVPARGLGGTPPVFTETVAGKKYGDEIKARLATLIPAFHTSLFASKEPLRADPTKMHAWSALEKPAEAAKDVTDAVYGSYATGAAITHASGNLIDQWDDEVVRNAALNVAEKKDKARNMVRYLIESNCKAINRTHSAVPSAPAEKAILDPIVESFVNTTAKVKTMLEIEVGWEGAQLQGVIYLQRFKESTDDQNRKLMWELFHTNIHEYIHALTHANFNAYAETFRAAGDPTRYNTLVEGFNDFFTENVRKTVSITTPLRQKVEGSYYDAGKPAPTVSPGLYPSRKQAEQVVSIVGIRNAQSAYFKGEVDKIGGP